MITELDIEQPAALRAYLREAGHIGAGEDVVIQPLAGGVSNRTVLVQRATGEAWVLKQALAKLRVSTDWFSSPDRIHREALGLRWLTTLVPPGTTTPLIFEDHQHHVLAMQAVPQPHVNWKTLLLAGQVEPDHCRQFGRLLGTIHSAAHRRRHELADIFGERKFFESLRLEPYYAYSAVHVPAAADFLQQLIADTRAHCTTLVHGDYSPKNILVYQGRLILLDHEVIHWGDPAFDLGFSLTHFLSKAHHLPQHRLVFAKAVQWYWDSYREVAGGLTDEREAVRHTLACLLARVAGRSPLEYLSPAERDRQGRAVVSLLNSPPPTIAKLVIEFLACL